jgi:ABC-type ATPase with predicted acetyltransferase domain
VILLWHNSEPIGICVFGTGAASLRFRSQFFGLKNPRSALAMRAMNEQLWLLQRVVLHPTYRGAGIAVEFVRRACELCPVRWIETLSAMGRVNPFFEHAGFVRVGVIDKRAGTGGAYTNQRTGSDPHRFSEPVYYVRENEKQA